MFHRFEDDAPDPYLTSRLEKADAEIDRLHQKIAAMETAHARELLHQYEEKERERRILNQLQHESRARSQKMIRDLIQDLNELMKASKDLIRTYPTLDTGVAVSNLQSVVNRILLSSKSKEEETV